MNTGRIASSRRMFALSTVSGLAMAMTAPAHAQDAEEQVLAAHRRRTLDPEFFCHGNKLGRGLCL